MGNGLNFFTNAIDKTPASKDSWQDVDVSGDGVPSGASGVILEIRSLTASGSENARLRKNGNTWDNERMALYLDYAGGYAFVGLDANRVFEAYVGADVQIWLVGYTGSDVVYFDNPSAESLGTAGVWTDLDKSSSIPSGATGVIALWMKDAVYTRAVGVRVNGRTYTFPYGVISASNSYANYIYQYCGLDSNRVLEYQVSNTSSLYLYIIAYTKGEIVFKTVPEENSPSSASAWTDVDVTTQTSATADGVLLMVKENQRWSGGQAHCRKNGSTDNRTTGRNIIGDAGQEISPMCAGLAIGLDAGQVYEAWAYSTTELDWYVIGYNQPSGETQISVTDSGAGSEILGKLRELGIITEAGSGSEAVTTPQRDIMLLDQAAAIEVLGKLRSLGVISDNALGTEGEVQVLLVGAGAGVIVVLIKRGAGISLSASLPKTISLHVSKPAITLGVNLYAN